MKPIGDIAGRLGNRMFQFAYVYAQWKRGAIPDVWIQGPQYFEDVREDILKMYGTGIQTRPEVGVHVRRGDYAWQPMFVRLWETDYYEKAMARFPDHRFVVVSDDAAWCRKHMLLPAELEGRVTVVGGKDEVEDMNTLAGCAHNVIANSSFSWWAAYLNPNPGRRVLYPKAWHTDGVERIQFPADWEAVQ